MRLALILLSMLLLGPALPARVAATQASAPASAQLNDGPYVVWDGPIAKVLVKRAAASATTTAGLRQALAEHLDQPAERTTFLSGN